MNNIKENITDLESLRNDIVIKQKKGLPFIGASIVIWLLILIVIMLDLPQDKENLFVFCCWSSYVYEEIKGNFQSSGEIESAHEFEFLWGDDVDNYNAEFWCALDELVNNSEIVIDRPKGTAHPKYSNFIYRVDYGYLKDTSSMDGAGIDVWVGSGERKVDAIMCIVDLMKKDSEIKILIGCTEEEKAIVYETHNETQFMKGVLIRR